MIINDKKNIQTAPKDRSNFVTPVLLPAEKINKKLKEFCERTSRGLEMQVCGLDLIFSNGKWYVIEANSCPSFDFIYHDENRLVKNLANYLYSECRKLG